MPPAVSPAVRSARIAFERDGHIYVSPLNRPQTAHRVGSGQDPTLSPDGVLVAFEEAAINSMDRHLAICDAATGRVLTRRPGVNPRISPDGRWIAFSRFANGKWTAWIARGVYPAGEARMLPHAQEKDGPAWISHWTADGLLVAYSDDLGGSVYILRPTGDVVQRVQIAEIAGGHDTMIPIGIAWSDDRKRLVFEATTGEELHTDDPGPLTGLFLYDFRSARLRQLTPRGIDGTGPVWTGPSEIAFTMARNGRRLGPPTLARMNISTGDIRPFLTNASNVSFS